MRWDSSTPLPQTPPRAAARSAKLVDRSRAVSYSPLSRIVELDGLITGVNGKLALWQALRDA
jgi:hypothetical protein